jgi:hypothetical protein
MNRYDIILKKPAPPYRSQRDKQSVNRTKRDVVDKILDMAFAESMMRCGNPDRQPGRLIRKLSMEERELLEDVTEKDFNHRIFK